jgi:hypothetical protein
MNLSILITGADSSQRKNKALEIASKNSSKFDIHILNAKEFYGIGDVKRFSEQVYKRPYQSSEKTMVILEAQTLTIEAQNALLKNLEAPPETTRFILTTPTSENLLSTVSSRCEKINLGSSTKDDLNVEQIKTFLARSAVDRYKSADRLDIHNWLLLWRSILLSNYGFESPSVTSEADEKRLLNYVKLISRLKNLQKRRASQKMIKTIMFLEAPKIRFL